MVVMLKLAPKKVILLRSGIERLSQEIMSSMLLRKTVRLFFPGHGSEFSVASSFQGCISIVKVQHNKWSAYHIKDYFVEHQRSSEASHPQTS